MTGLAWGLLGLWAGVLIAAFAFGQYNEARTRHDVRPLLMVTSALLVALAALFWLEARGSRAQPFALLIAFGMAASFLGDLVMAEYIRTPNRVIFGGAVFVLAHIWYVAASAGAAVALGVERSPVVLAAVVLLGASLWAALIRSREMRPAMNYAVLVYMLILSTMTGQAVALAFAVPGVWMLAVGAILFLASDVVLLNQICRKNDWFLVSDVVWVLYISGQALIVWSNRAVAGLVR